MAVLKDVVLAYVKIQQPAQKFETEGPQNTEWTVDCIVDEKTAKRWKKEFKKQPPREFDNEEFKKVFKIDPPYPDQDEQYVIKLKKDTHFKDKETGRMKSFESLDPKTGKYRVKLYEKIGTRDDGKPMLVDITKKKLVSNGSTGVVMYDVVTNKFGTFAKLKAVRVDNLIEYQSADSVDELGEVVDAEDYTADAGDEDFGSEESGGEDDAPFEPDEDDSDY